MSQVRRWILVLLWVPLLGFAAHFENLVDVTLKVEDGSVSHKIKSLQFNHEEIKLDPSDMFKPRKVIQYKLPPGRYLLSWSTEKTTSRLSEASSKSFEKIVVLEQGDGIVRIHIKGDATSMY